MTIDNELERELSQLIAHYLADSATAEQFDRLQYLLNVSEDARMFYVCSVGIDLQLYWDRRPHEVRLASQPEDQPSAAATEQATDNAELDDDWIYSLAEEPPAPRPESLPTYVFVDEAPDPAGPRDSMLSRWWRTERIAEMVCATVFFVILLGMLSFSAHVAPKNGLQATKAVGRVTNLAGCRWDAESPPLSFYDRVAIGQKIQLAAGLLEIRYDTGATVVLQGPVTYEIRSENSGFLASGKMTGKVTGPNARGFAVSTPTVEVVDLGTEFGVEVSPSRETTSHVFRGAVKLVAAAESGEPIAFVVKQNQSFRVEPNPKHKHSVVIVPCGAAQPKKFVRQEQLSPFGRWQAHSQDLHRDPALLAYYDFQKHAGSPSVLANSAQGSNASRHGTINGAVWTEGRWPGKDALQFNGPDDYVELRLPETIRDLTLAAWVRLDSLADEPSALLMSDANEQGRLQWQLTQAGQMCCDFLGKGGAAEGQDRRHNLSPRLFDADRLGRWTHLAVVYDQATGNITFFCDGRQVSTAKALIEDRQTIRIGAASIGRWTTRIGGQTQGSRNLHGQIDELAVFARSLAPNEIHRMFEAGRGKETENR